MKNTDNIYKERTFEGFKLLSVEFYNDHLFGDTKYEFIDNADAIDQIYTTVLIGQNGTLKSRLFQSIIMMFWRLHDLKNAKEPYIDMDFRLTYSYNNLIYEFSCWPKEEENGSPVKLIEYTLKINGKEQSGFSKAALPKSIIANAIMLTDRFPFPDQKNFSIYHYLGSRFRPQLSSTKTFIGRVVEFVSKNIDSKSFISSVRKIAKEFLHESHQPCITYYTSNTHRFFRGNMNTKEFFSFFEEIDLKYKDKTTLPPFKLNHYKSKIKKDKTLSERIVQYCNDLKESKRLRGFSRKASKAITFNLFNETDVKLLRLEFELLNHLRQLGIIYPAEIEFLKKEPDSTFSGYSIVQSSSGEHNLFGSMIGLVASITPDSLLFIDEPEISLHPNWQMRYISFLTELLSDKQYASCHIIVATHSHFLISDLKGENSSVVGLKRDEKTNKIEANLLRNADTFGWSAEDVLYNVFNVRSSLNYYLEADLTELLGMISNNIKDIEKIERIVNKIDKLPKRENDPLQEILSEAKDYLISIKS